MGSRLAFLYIDRMEEMQNLQELKHRLNFCLRAIKSLGMGDVQVDEYRFNPVYQVVKNNVVIYSFPTLEKFERFVENSLSRHTSLVISDKSFNRRMTIRREQRLAKANGRSSYLLRSSI